MPSIALSRRSLQGLALGLVVALAGTASLTAWAQPHHGPGRHEAGFAMGGSPRHLERLLDGVDATDAQRAQIRQIAEAARTDLQAQREAGKALRERQMQLFTQPSVDANAVESLRQQMLAQHDQASRRITQAMLDASRVLTPEQRLKLAEKMKSRRDLMQRHQRERRAIDKPAG